MGGARGARARRHWSADALRYLDQSDPYDGAHADLPVTHDAATPTVLPMPYTCELATSTPDTRDGETHGVHTYIGASHRSIAPAERRSGCDS